MAQLTAHLTLIFKSAIEIRLRRSGPDVSRLCGWLFCPRSGSRGGDSRARVACVVDGRERVRRQEDDARRAGALGVGRRRVHARRLGRDERAHGRRGDARGDDFLERHGRRAGAEREAGDDGCADEAPVRSQERHLLHEGRLRAGRSCARHHRPHLRRTPSRTKKRSATSARSTTCTTSSRTSSAIRSA